MPTPLNVAAVRANFPALDQDQVFFDNAGGSQVLAGVIDSISIYLSRNNVQLGASYPVSAKSTAAFDDGFAAGAKYINAKPSEVVFGSATTQMFRNLSIALKIEPGSEIVLSNLDHEANLAPWVQLAEWRNLTIKWWIPSKSKINPVLETCDLEKLLSSKTRLVCCTHTSNILGSITRIRELADCIHSTVPNCLFCVDAVAYAPHRGLDMQALGADFYSFSWYKVYGPHIAMLYVSEKAQKQLNSLGHYFKTGDTLEEKLGLAGCSYEAVQCIPEIVKYLESIGWEAIAEYEEKISEILLSYLRSKPDLIQIWGEPTAAKELRVPVISFTVKGRTSANVIEAIEAKSHYGCRNGHFYSKRLINNVLGIPGEDGIVRVSMLHYNTEDEVKGLVKVLSEVIGK